MTELMIMLMLPFIISTIMYLVKMMLMTYKYNNKSKNNPFECGFNPLKKARPPLSLRFLSITIIFLIFDVEISFLFPLMFTKMITFNHTIILNMSFLLSILFLGLLYEINLGLLKWVK